ncbi:T9SS type B sorting domain-containing protein [Flavobacterium undicola]|uniref:T9SS type B sorting domain-containing protein n=1 Tax=Flavobacterium undicola TaxID=1932779 RepID=UPI001376E190|nr:T9SS type B sorting domain-containing protein [Flavobacterium undicola]MBA0883276.1 T9SS type B sorting domain-containing protein [Flavobacterium undicola]
MKKSILLLVFVCLVNLLIGSSVFAQTPPPTVSSPVYYCQGSTAVALTATPSPGATLNWYGIAAVGGTASSIAQTPSTTTVGSTSYYVSQTIGAVESTRSSIVVNVVADNGSKILLFRCDESQIALPSTRYDAVFFEWTNTSGVPNQYTYSYSIDGAAAINGNINNGTHLQVSGLTQGQSVTMTLYHTTYPCDRSVLTCTVPCNTLSTPTFDPIGPICSGDPAPTLPAASKEGIIGTWSPAIVNNTTSGTYVFTPNTNECARNQTISIVVNPNNPGFSDFSICSGNGAPTLDTTSPSGATGTWNPATVDDINSASYTFIPDPGQCATSQTIDVTVIPSNTLVDFDWEVTEAFVPNQKIAVSAIAAGGDYWYQLDDGLFQSNPVFEYVASGLHSITVKDQTGCSTPITKTDIMVVNYPKYFTPNNDGYNDYWNITELSAQPYAYIRIFDRYGKFLKQISPNGAGWNGTFNGHYVPADDYWFVIHYLENDIVKEFRSHFSLKR